MDSSFWVNLAFLVPLGCIFAVWAERMIRQERTATGQSPPTPGQTRRRLIGLTLVYAALTVALSVSAELGMQSTPEVQPTTWGFFLRRCSHQLLIGFILVAMAVDWDGYVIPDQITLPGTLLGVAGAVAVGQLQLIHLWVDWSYALPQIRGPWIPAWIDAHRHLHGLAWSLAGLIAGAGLTAIVRSVSSRLMGLETLGTGDITFMALIGSFLGWQPTVCAFLAAPLLGLAVGLPLKLVTNKPYIPYGPFLGAGALLTLFAWGPIWGRTKDIFGDWLALLILFALASVSFVVLFGLLILYRRLPGRTTSDQNN
ncbi:MAG: A24 family peptidase [Planctomycetaceae bacterium]